MSSDVRVIVNEQKRRRRLAFWGGFVALALIGSLWAGLSKDPRGPGFFGDEGFADEPAIVEADFVEAPPPPIFTTTTAPATTGVPTTRADDSTTSVPSTTVLAGTAADAEDTTTEVAE